MSRHCHWKQLKNAIRVKVYRKRKKSECEPPVASPRRKIKCVESPQFYRKFNVCVRGKCGGIICKNACQNVCTHIQFFWGGNTRRRCLITTAWSFVDLNTKCACSTAGLVNLVVILRERVKFRALFIIFFFYSGWKKGIILLKSISWM